MPSSLPKKLPFQSVTAIPGFSYPPSWKRAFARKSQGLNWISSDPRHHNSDNKKNNGNDMKNSCSHSFWRATFEILVRSFHSVLTATLEAGTVITSFYRGGDWGCERLGNLPSVSQLAVVIVWPGAAAKRKHWYDMHSCPFRKEPKQVYRWRWPGSNEKWKNTEKFLATSICDLWQRHLNF